MRFLAIARMAFFREAYYRFEILFNALRSVVVVLVLTAVWRAVYSTRPLVAGFTLEDVILYTCTATALSLLYEVNVEREIGERLRSGNLALQLLKPVNFFLYGFAEGWGTLVYTALFSALPTAAALFLLFDLPAPGLAHLGLGALVVILGFTLFFSVCHLTALTTFFTEDVWGVEYLRITLLRFFAGGFLPLAFFPEALQRVAGWLPFPYITYFPTLVLTGRLPEGAAAGVLLVQAGWAVALLGLNYAYWKLLVKHVTIHGG